MANAVRLREAQSITVLRTGVASIQVPCRDSFVENSEKAAAPIARRDTHSKR